MAVENSKVSDDNQEMESPKRRPKILAPPCSDVLRTPPIKRRRRGDISFDFVTPRRADFNNSGSEKRFSRYSYMKDELKAAERIKAIDGSFLSCFFTKAYVFSNHFSQRNGLITIDGIKFICTEQYYMFYKARVFGDMAAAHEIMKAPDARSMKKLGSLIVGFDLEKWRRVAILVMVIASLRKYEQNAELRKLLFETEDSIIVETNPGDSFWGVGLFMHDPLLKDVKSWKGKNVLGRILMKVREILLAREEFQPPSIRREKKSSVKTPNSIKTESRKSKLDMTAVIEDKQKSIKASKRKLRNELQLTYTFDKDDEEEDVVTQTADSPIKPVVNEAEKTKEDGEANKSKRKRKAKSTSLVSAPSLISPKSLKEEINNNNDKIEDIQLPTSSIKKKRPKIKVKPSILPEEAPPTPPRKQLSVGPAEKEALQKERQKISFKFAVKETVTSGKQIAPLNGMRNLQRSVINAPSPSISPSEEETPTMLLITVDGRTAGEARVATPPNKPVKGTSTSAPPKKTSIFAQSRLFLSAVKSIQPKPII